MIPPLSSRDKESLTQERAHLLSKVVEASVPSWVSSCVRTQMGAPERGSILMIAKPCMFDSYLSSTWVPG